MSKIRKLYPLLILCMLAFLACSREDYKHGPMATPTYGLPPITIKLQNRLIEILKQTDELDTLIKRGCTADEYFAAGAPIEKAAMEMQDTLPRNDSRIYLFVGTVGKYQALGVKLAKSEPKDELYAQDALAGISKLLILGVLNGTLTDDEAKMFNDMKQQIQSGKWEALDR